MKIKLIALGALALISSCGEELPRNDGGLNKEVETLIGSLKVVDESEKLTQEEANLILKACSNLERKRQKLGDFVDLRTSLKYQKFSKGCSDEEESAPESFSATITFDSSTFKYSDNSPFAYVVTDQNFTMGDVCSHVQAAAESGERPELPSKNIMTGVSSDPVWVSAYGRGSSQCENKEDIVCVYIQTGSATTNENRYRVSNVKSYSIIGENDDPDKGFVSTRLEARLCAKATDKFQYTKTQLVSTGL